METPQTPEQKAEWVISNATLPSELKNVIYHQTLLNFKNSPQIKSLHDCLPLTFYKTNFANLQSHAMDPLLALGFIFQDGDDIIFYQPKNSADLVKEQNNIHHFQTIENNLEWTKIDNQKFKIFDKRNSDEVKIEFSQDQQRIPFMNDLITIQNRDLSRGTMCRIAVASYCPFNHKKIYEKKGFICTSETYSNEPFIFFKISTKNNRIYDQLFFYSAVNNSFGFFGIVETGTLPTKTRYFFTSLNEHKKYLEEKNWILDEQQTKLVNDAYSFLDALKEKSDEHTMQNVLKFLEEFKERKDKINILWLTQDELTKQNPFKELHELVKKLSNNNNN
jgi:hypothetical protein